MYAWTMRMISFALSSQAKNWYPASVIFIGFRPLNNNLHGVIQAIFSRSACGDARSGWMIVNG
jgi:hypothetical protein